MFPHVNGTVIQLCFHFAFSRFLVCGCVYVDTSRYLWRPDRDVGSLGAGVPHLLIHMTWMVYSELLSLTRAFSIPNCWAFSSTLNFFFLNMYGCFACIHVCVPCAYNAWGSQKRSWNCSYRWLLGVMQGTKNQTQIYWKSKPVLLTPEPSLQPPFLFFRRSSVCECSAHRGQSRVLNCIELGLQWAVSCSSWVLGALHTLNC